MVTAPSTKSFIWASTGVAASAKGTRAAIIIPAKCREDVIGRFLPNFPVPFIPCTRCPARHRDPVLSAPVAGVTGDALGIVPIEPLPRAAPPNAVRPGRRSTAETKAFTLTNVSGLDNRKALTKNQEIMTQSRRRGAFVRANAGGARQAAFRPSVREGARQSALAARRVFSNA